MYLIFFCDQTTDLCDNLGSFIERKVSEVFSFSNYQKMFGEDVKELVSQMLH